MYLFTYKPEEVHYVEGTRGTCKEIKVLFSFKANKFYHDLLLNSASILYLVFELVKALPDVDHLADAPVQQKIYKRQNSLKEE